MIFIPPGSDKSSPAWRSKSTWRHKGPRARNLHPSSLPRFLVARRIAQEFADAEPARLAEVDRLAADLPIERIELTSRDEPL